MLQFWINVSQKGRVVWSRSNRKIIGHWKLGITKRLQINRVQFSKTNKLMLNYGQKLRMLQQLLFELQSMQQQIIKQKAATAEAETEKGMKDKYAAELNKMEKGVALRITSFQKSVE